MRCAWQCPRVGGAVGSRGACKACSDSRLSRPLPAHCAAAAHPGEPPLWGIPVTPAAGEPGEQAAPQPAHSLQAALQQLLDQAAEAGGDAEAIGAIAQAAAAMAAMEEEVLAAAEEEGEEEEEGAEDGSGSEGEAAGGEAQLAGGAGGVLDELQQLGEQAAQVAAQMGGAPHAPGGAAGPLHPVAAEHSARVGRGGHPALLWSLLGAGLAQWEVAHRDPEGEPGPAHTPGCRGPCCMDVPAADSCVHRSATDVHLLPCPAPTPAGAPAPEVAAAHWRALRSIAPLAAAAPQDGASSRQLLEVLGGLAAGRLPEAQLLTGPPSLAAALLPGLQQLQLAPSHRDCATGQARRRSKGAGKAGDQAGCRMCALRHQVLLSPFTFLSISHPQDPFALLLQLLPALLGHPGDARFAPTGPLASSLECIAHRRPAELLRALLAVLYPIAAAQAAAAATGGARSAADTAAALAASPPLASALESAVCSQLLPFLQRAAVLLSLLSGAPAPAPPALDGGSAAPAVAALLQQLGLPPVLAALQSPAAASLQLPPGAAAALPAASTELSLRAGQEQWVVAVLPPPSPPKLLQLPLSYQVRPWQLHISTYNMHRALQAVLDVQLAGAAAAG